MALICQRCDTVHPDGAISCEHARRLRSQQEGEMQARIAAHKEICDCSDPAGHIRKRERERGVPDILFRPIGARA